MPTTLGVAQQGGPQTGQPFNSLFDRIVPIHNPQDTLRIDCLLLWGGTDISASLYGEEPASYNEGPAQPSKRDLIEWECIKKCVANNIPIIGVCRGAQLLCVYDGGKLAQDVSGHLAGHEIVTEDGEVFMASANHHQMMLPRKNAHIIATSKEQLHGGMYVGSADKLHFITDGTLDPEVVFFPDIKALGIQPHPEWQDPNTPFVKWVLDVVHTQFLG